MKEDEIKIDDWQRIFIGEIPPIFLLEVVIRVLLIYLILMVCVRIIGNRMSYDFSKIEMITRICLAAAIGIPLQEPGRGILPAVIVAIVAVVGERVVSYFSFRNKTFEKITQDDLDVLVSNSVVQFNSLKKSKISRERLFAELRSHSIYHLGEVKRLYMEATGILTMIKNEEPYPGLSVIPDWDNGMRNDQEKADFEVCKTCGMKREEANGNGKCKNCKEEKWETAVK